MRIYMYLSQKLDNDNLINFTFISETQSEKANLSLNLNFKNVKFLLIEEEIYLPSKRASSGV